MIIIRVYYAYVLAKREMQYVHVRICKGKKKEERESDTPPNNAKSRFL